MSIGCRVSDLTRSEAPESREPTISFGVGHRITQRTQYESHRFLRNRCVQFCCLLLPLHNIKGLVKNLDGDYAESDYTLHTNSEQNGLATTIDCEWIRVVPVMNSHPQEEARRKESLRTVRSTPRVQRCGRNLSTPASL